MYVLQGILVSQSHPHLVCLFHIVSWEPPSCETSKVPPPPSTIVLLDIVNDGSLTEGKFI